MTTLQAMTTGTRLGQHFTRAGIALGIGSRRCVVVRVEIVDIAGQTLRISHDIARGQHALDQAGGTIADIIADLGAVDGDVVVGQRPLDGCGDIRRAIDQCTVQIEDQGRGPGLVGRCPSCHSFVAACEPGR